MSNIFKPLPTFFKHSSKLKFNANTKKLFKDSIIVNEIKIGNSHTVKLQQPSNFTHYRLDNDESESGKLSQQFNKRNGLENENGQDYYNMIYLQLQQREKNIEFNELLAMMKSTNIEDFDQYCDGDRYILLEHYQRQLRRLCELQDKDLKLQQTIKMIEALSQFVIQTRDKSIQYFVELEQSFNQLFNDYDQLYSEAIQSPLINPSDAFYIFFISSNANLLTYNLYQISEKYFLKNLFKFNDLQILRLQTYFQKYDQFFYPDNLLRKKINKFFEQNLNRMHTFKLAKLFFQQLCFKDVDLKQQSGILPFDNILKYMTTKDFSLLDAKTCKFFFLSLYYLESSEFCKIYMHRDVQRFYHSEFMGKTQNYQKKEYQDQGEFKTQRETITILQKKLDKIGIKHRIIQEQPVIGQIYSIDMILDAPELDIKDQAFEIRNFRAKNFRTGFNNPRDIFRHKLITEKTDYKSIIYLDTQEIEDYLYMSDERKGDAIYDYLLKKKRESQQDRISNQ
ncbi:UNKNOWN [Stylonychia lemnae]|uniref:Uncharacterized protein n=1 Tax=Stylonychia lemnae TaxID=5949 RepID=A0A078BD04_STYLE|nr:UNKNOWN [Stylonychia lemnae]|eukprot:CDW91097.1 UNKNOWN [Stylonychia lemnae]